MIKKATASSSYTKTLLQAMTFNGVDSQSVLRASGITNAMLNDPDARIPFDNFLNAWQSAIKLSGNPCLGLDATALFHPSTYGPISCVIMMSPNLGDMAKQIIRFQQMPQTAAHASMGYEGDLAYIELDQNSYDDEFIRPAIEYALIEPLYIARFATAHRYHEKIRPRKIYFKHANPNPNDNFDDRLDAPIYFSQPYNRAYFDADILLIPTNFSDQSLYKSVLEKIEEISKIDEHEFADQVRWFVIRNLPRGVPSIQITAKNFNLSYRTLQRRLHDEGINYKQLVSDTRKDLSAKLLMQNSASISEISFLLGFQTVSSFHKAFKRWFKVSPGEFRKSKKEKSDTP
jgi:AraC-like DNA-binding protein